MNYYVQLPQVELALRAIVHELDIQSRARMRRPRDEHSLWQELVACILGSAVPFAVAHSFAQHLASVGLLERGRRRFEPRAYESDLAEGLSTAIPLSGTSSNSERRYRFPRLRANHIRRTAEIVYAGRNSLKRILDGAEDERETRQRLVKLAYGVGPKQASLFLRNVGHAQTLAILDVHVLGFVDRFLGKDSTQTPSTLRAYESIEDGLRQYAEDFGAPLSVLDTAIWVVMRVLKRSEERWR